METTTTQEPRTEGKPRAVEPSSADEKPRVDEGFFTQMEPSAEKQPEAAPRPYVNGNSSSDESSSDEKFTSDQDDSGYGSQSDSSSSSESTLKPVPANTHQKVGPETFEPPKAKVTDIVVTYSKIGPDLFKPPKVKVTDLVVTINDLKYNTGVIVRDGFVNELKDDSEDESEGSSTDDSDDDDTQSDSSADTASTYKYEHETYNTFKDKVVDLITEIGGKDVQLLDRIRGGAFNRIVPVKFHLKTQWDPEGMSCVARIPRMDQQHDTTYRPREENGNIRTHQGIFNQIAVQGLVCERGIPTPRVLAYDAAWINAIKRPYALYELAEGTRLDMLYPDMSFEEKRNVVDLYIDLIVQLDAIEFPVSGKLCSPAHKNDVWRLPMELTEPPKEEPFSEKIRVDGFGIDEWFRVPGEARPMADLQGLFDELLSCHMAEAMLDTEFDFDKRTIGKLQSILEDMKGLGFFDDLPLRNTIYHWDLESRNILIAPTTDGTAGNNKAWRLSSVLDWDDALSLPPILTRRPPMWLWDPAKTKPTPANPDSGQWFDDDYDLLDPARYDASSGLLSAENQDLRAYFETEYVRKVSASTPSYSMTKYRDEAYGKGRWLRRLYRFATRGLGNCVDYHHYETFVEEWDQLQASRKSS